jgi:exopolysaccharide biosynthesis polyprenyl glycosylphosphotransferase
MAASTQPRPLGWRVRSRDQRTILFISDLLVAYVALAISLFIWSLRDQWGPTFFSERVNPNLWFYFLPLIWIALMGEMYDPHRAKNIRKTVIGISLAFLAGLIVYALVYLVAPKGSLPRWGVVNFLVFSSLLTLAWRLTYIRIFTHQSFLRRVLVVGAGQAGCAFAQVYKSLRPSPFNLIGYIDDDPTKTGKNIEEFPILAGSKCLSDLIEKEAVSDLVIAITGKMNSETFQCILDAQERGVDVIPMPLMYEELLRRVPIQHLESEWLVRSFVNEARVNGFYEILKRFIDIVVSSIGMLVYLIIYPFIALAILSESGFPVLYKQIRSGKSGKPFSIYKFRTMRQDAEKDGQARPASKHDPRITRVGNFLRKTHLDEMPNSWNVLRGEMSIVGPRAERPELIEAFQKVVPFYRARLLVKPGITGWAQVNYGYTETAVESMTKLEYDLFYIKSRNLLMDFSIIFRTVGQVLGLRGR